jgi:hypothetical protein
MSSTERHRSPVYRQLEAYEEAWKAGHEDAMVCRDGEDAIAVGLAIYHMLWERQHAWRDRVFRGAIPYSEEDERDHQARLADWLATTTEVLAETLPRLEARFGTVEGAAQLRRCAEAVEAILSAWVPPRLSRAVGLRDQTLSPEAAAEFDRILSEAQTKPPPVPAGPIPQIISAEEFFAQLKPPRS